MAVPRVIKGYELREKIGGGGFGDVYRAYQPVVDRNVAIKIIKPDYANDPDFIRSFEEEAHYVARLEHPHIIPLYDYWRDSGGAYLVMRYTRGGSLRTRINNGLLPFEEVTKIVSKIGDALAFAHRNRVIHRDLKPDNILIDDEGHPYLTDFGIARYSGKASTSSSITGSLEYMSPQQLNGEPPAPTMDIYSFGIIIFELLAGYRPFKGAKLEVVMKHSHEKIPNICEIRPDLELRAAVDSLLQKACAKNASERYPDMQSLLAAYTDATEGTGVISLDIEAPVIINPYKGLRSFEIEDEQDFFGREEVVQKLANRLQENTPYKRFLAVVGPSGSGKSSVVKAGLIPALRKGIIPNSASWFIVQMVPGDQPLNKLTAAITSIAPHIPQDLNEQLRKNEFALAELTPQLLEGVHGDVLLVIDHFEELFTLVDDEAEVQQFLHLLYHALIRPNSRLWVIIALRSDFYDNLILNGHFAQLIQERTHVVIGMSADELTKAIRAPAERVGLTVEANLIATIIADSANNPGTLPLLQYALTETFEHRSGKRLTLAAYQQMGGIVGAVSNRAEAIYQGLTQEQQAIARQVFVRLGQANEQDEITRRRVRRSDLIRLGNPAVINAVLNLFEYYDLLIFDHELGTREPTVEVAHEALFKGWMRLNNWSKESLEDLRLEQWLETVTQEWLQSGREISYLAVGTRLALLEEWVQKKIVPLTAQEQDFFDASLAERDERAQRELHHAQEATALAQQVAAEAQKAAGEAQKATKAQRAATVRLGIVVVLLIAMVIGALVLTAIAQRSAAQAESLAQAFNAQVEFNHDNNQVALRLALDAAQVENPPAIVQSMLIDAAYAPGTVSLYDAFDHELKALALSRDGRFVLIGEGTSSTESGIFDVQLWDVDSGQWVRTLLENTAPNTALAFNPDASIAYTGDNNGIVRALDVQTGEELWQIVGQAPIRSIRISHDGKQMLFGGGTYDAEAAPETEYAIWLVDAQTGATVCELLGHISPVYSVAFSPDDTVALSGSGTWRTSQGDNSLRSWNLATCEPIRRMNGHEDIIQDIAFSPDGLTAVTASADHTLIRWSLDTGEILQQYGADGDEGHTDWVNRVVTHPDGRWMLSAGWDNQLILWDLWTGNVLHRFIGHLGPVNGVALAPDGQFAFSISDDKTMRVWEITNALLEQRFDVEAATAMLRVRISPNQQYVVSGSTDGVLRLWDIATGQIIWDKPAHLDRIYALAFSPDNRYIVSGGADQKLYLWDVITGERLREFSGHSGRIWMVDYSPNSQYVVSGSDDYTVRLWDVTTGVEVLAFSDLRDIYAVDFSPDSRYVLAGGIAAKLYLFDIEEQTLLHTFEGHTTSINAIDFSPDGHFAVSGGYDNHLLLWDIANRRSTVQLNGHFAPISGVEFSTDGNTVLSGAADGTIRLWNWREGTEQGRVTQNTQILSIGISAEAQLVVIGSQGAIDLLRLPDANIDDLILWIHANRYLGE